MVEVVDDGFGVVLGASCKDVDVVDLAHSVEELQTVRPYVELKLITLITKLNVSLFVGEDRVNQCLVKIQNEELLPRVLNKTSFTLGLWQLDSFLL